MRSRAAVLLALLVVSSTAHADDSLKSLSKRLAKGSSALKVKKVAVLAFPYHDGRISSGSSIVPERLTTEMVGRKGICVVERRLIEKLMSERKLDQTGVINTDNLKTIGTLLEADAVVTGTLIDLENGTTEINARLIGVETGEMLAAGQETIKRTWRDPPCVPESEKPKPKSVVIPPAPDVVMEVVVPAPPPMRQMRLSNESFPEGRRNYYKNEPVQRPAPRKEERGERNDEDGDWLHEIKRAFIGDAPANKPPPKDVPEDDMYKQKIYHPAARRKR